MNIVELCEHNEWELAEPLVQFEAAFSYPLGASQRFGIRHGRDYCRFFRAMGPAACFLAVEKSLVVGAIAVVLRRVFHPDGSIGSAAYLCDLKIAPAERGGRLLLRLAQHAAAWGSERTDAAFSIVMGGTAVTPDAYTGRAGLPRLSRLTNLAVIRTPVPQMRGGQLSTDGRVSSASAFRALSAGRYATPAETPLMRSSVTPQGVDLENGAASGFVEDTREAKRLIVEGGEELVSAHLSNFAFRSIADGAQLVRGALACAARMQYPALFFAVHESEAEPILRQLNIAGTTVASATVYGFGMTAGAAWNVNTSEI